MGHYIISRHFIISIIMSQYPSGPAIYGDNIMPLPIHWSAPRRLAHHIYTTRFAHLFFTSSTRALLICDRKLNYWLNQHLSRLIPYLVISCPSRLSRLVYITPRHQSCRSSHPHGHRPSIQHPSNQIFPIFGNYQFPKIITTRQLSFPTATQPYISLARVIPLQYGGRCQK